MGTPSPSMAAAPNSDPKAKSAQIPLLEMPSAPRGSSRRFASLGMTPVQPKSRASSVASVNASTNRNRSTPSSRNMSGQGAPAFGSQAQTSAGQKPHRRRFNDTREIDVLKSELAAQARASRMAGTMTPRSLGGRSASMSTDSLVSPGGFGLLQQPIRSGLTPPASQTSLLRVGQTFPTRPGLSPSSSTMDMTGFSEREAGVRRVPVPEGMGIGVTESPYPEFAKVLDPDAFASGNSLRGPAMTSNPDLLQDPAVFAAAGAPGTPDLADHNSLQESRSLNSAWPQTRIEGRDSPSLASGHLGSGMSMSASEAQRGSPLPPPSASFQNQVRSPSMEGIQDAQTGIPMEGTGVPRQNVAGSAAPATPKRLKSPLQQQYTTPEKQGSTPNNTKRDGMPARMSVRNIFGTGPQTPSTKPPLPAQNTKPSEPAASTAAARPPPSTPKTPSSNTPSSRPKPDSKPGGGQSVWKQIMSPFRRKKKPTSQPRENLSARPPLPPNASATVKANSGAASVDAAPKTAGGMPSAQPTQMAATPAAAAAETTSSVPSTMPSDKRAPTPTPMQAAQAPSQPPPEPVLAPQLPQPPPMPLPLAAPQLPQPPPMPIPLAAPQMASPPPRPLPSPMPQPVPAPSSSAPAPVAPQVNGQGAFASHAAPMPLPRPPVAHDSVHAAPMPLPQPPMAHDSVSAATPVVSLPWQEPSGPASVAKQSETTAPPAPQAPVPEMYPPTTTLFYRDPPVSAPTGLKDPPAIGSKSPLRAPSSPVSTNSPWARYSMLHAAPATETVSSAQATPSNFSSLPASSAVPEAMPWSNSTAALPTPEPSMPWRSAPPKSPTPPREPSPVHPELPSSTSPPIFYVPPASQEPHSQHSSMSNMPWAVHDLPVGGAGSNAPSVSSHVHDDNLTLHAGTIGHGMPSIYTGHSSTTNGTVGSTFSSYSQPPPVPQMTYASPVMPSQPDPPVARNESFANESVHVHGQGIGGDDASEPYEHDGMPLSRSLQEMIGFTLMQPSALDHTHNS